MSLTSFKEFGLVLALAFMVLGARAQTYLVPSTGRADISLDSGWRFIRQDVAGAQTNGFDDSGWTQLTLPHTWNNLDGQDGGNNYYRGIGWYRLHYTFNTNLVGQRLFLTFDAANIVSDVYVNGNFMGEHQGGFAAFNFDVTPYVNFGVDNVIAVKVNNAVNTNVPPLSADFTFFGGLYRDVHLLVTDPVHVSPLDYASPGVYLLQSNVSSNSANLQVTTVVSNAAAVPANVTVRAVLTDAATNIVATLTNVVTLPPASISNVVAATSLANPHLWNGLSDPYLYQAFVEIYNGTNLTDLVSQPLGFRYYRIDPTNGFFLNGNFYDLHGVAMHQDWLNCGWALNNSQRQTNFMLLKELGVTAVRLSHYQHHDYTYQLADHAGIILWSEVPVINSVSASAAFTANAVEQLRELIRQRFNHPSVICWGVFNEITLVSGPSPTNVVSTLVQTETQEDPSRPSAAANLAGNGDASSWIPQVIAFNEYYGWYSSPLNGIAAWSDNIHAAHPTNAIGITEYGAGASIYQHSENPVAQPATSGPYHPEEWQNIVHETNWGLMHARPALWIKTAWNMFDFASDGRNEGDTPGRNDKGLVTYDRQVRKDAFYFYKANWTTNPMVYITGHTFTNRLTNAITAKVYANCDSVELFLNGVSQGVALSTNNIFTWPVTLALGSNYVQAVGSKGGSNVTDSLVWFAPIPPPLLSVASPVGAVASLNSTNSSLFLSVNVSNPVPANPLTTTWSQLSGPAPVAFANSNAPTTSVSFGSNGIYRLSLTASNGAVSSAAVLVLVNADSSVTNGLEAWWKMDETGGTIAADSSGNGRNATVVNGFFTSGYISNALRFTNSTGNATYSAQQSNEVTVAAWVRCDTTGGGTFPRILDTPSYRFFFRFSSSDVNSVGFATYDTTNGDFDSGGGTISLGTWYHVAARYDRGSLANPPTLYINGAKVPTTTLALPSGTVPPLSGTAYIGNSSANNRSWNGLIDDLRVYDRILTDAEIQVLAAAPPANLAPVVFAGTNQTSGWPAAVSLSGTVKDDGNPNPPGSVVTAWSQLSGPGSVAFANSNLVTTTATFSSPGYYILQLLANDGQAESVSSVSINSVVRPTLSAELQAGSLQLSWPNSGWRLQSQTNPLTVGLSTNWFDVPGATGTNALSVPIDSTNGSVFFRLVTP